MIKAPLFDSCRVAPVKFTQRSHTHHSLVTFEVYNGSTSIGKKGSPLHVKKLTALTAAAALLLALFAGCGSSNNAGGGGNNNNSPAAAQNATLTFSGTTVTAYVTAVSGSDVTVSLISFPSGMRNAGNGANGTTSGNDGTAPGAATPQISPNQGSGAPASGTPDSGTQGPGGQQYSGRGQNGQGFGRFFASGGLSATLTINNPSILIKDGNAAALTDIQTGDTLVIAFGSDGQIQSVTIQAAASGTVPYPSDPTTTVPNATTAPTTSA